MSKNTNLSFLTDYITADITNGRIGINTPSPTVAFDVTGVSKFTGASTFSTTVGIGTTSPNASWGATIANSTLYSSNALRLERNGIPTQGLNIIAGGEVVTFNGFNTASDGLNSAFVWTSTAFNTTTERMRITSAGNVGIGTATPLDTYTGRTVLTINNNGAFGAFLNFGYNGSLYGFICQNTDILQIGTQANIPMSFGTNANERMRIISTGNILVNTSTNYALGNDNNKGIIINGVNPYTPFLSFRVSDVSKGVIYANINEMLVYAQANIPMIFGTNDTERMRITSGGAILVGTTSLTSTGTFNSYSNGSSPAGRFVGGPSMADGNIALMVDKYSGTTSTSQWFLGFTVVNQAQASGVITANGASQAAFGSWSDGRLKENIVDLPNQLSNILALRPVEFDYIESEGGGHQTSFIAQEFEEIYPDAVGQRPDGMKTLTGWGKTEAILVKAIQELSAEITILKNK